MISHIANAGVTNRYQNSETQQKKASNLEGETTQVSQQGDHSKIDSLKESIKNGDYQLNLRALAEKIADELV
jgi:anti-sigma28 factor (negative regulator of flagellin synthesis)